MIPGNDDAIRSIRAVTKLIADAVLAGREEFEKQEAERLRIRAQEAEAAIAASSVAAQENKSTADAEAEMLQAAQAKAAPQSSAGPAVAPSNEVDIPPKSSKKVTEPASPKTVRRARRKPASKTPSTDGKDPSSDGTTATQNQSGKDRKGSSDA